MPSKVEDTYCVRVGDLLCAVLGNHYPNYPGNLSKASDSDEVVIERNKNAKVFCTQRLCDQTMVQYKFVVVSAPTCPNCLRIKNLMVEFARPADQETDDDREDDPAEPSDPRVAAEQPVPDPGGSEDVLHTAL